MHHRATRSEGRDQTLVSILVCLTVPFLHSLLSVSSVSSIAHMLLSLIYVPS